MRLPIQCFNGLIILEICLCVQLHYLPTSFFEYRLITITRLGGQL